MPKVNYGVEPHPDPQADNGFFSDRGRVWEPFPKLSLPDDNDEQKEAWRIAETLGRAIQYIDSRVKKHDPCNSYFRKPPKGRSFAEIWDDPDVWLNFAPKLPDWGFTRDPKDVLISKEAFKQGHLFVAATIVHELAHVGGAPGTGANPPSNAAEVALKYCLLTQQFDPNIFGVLDDFPNGPGTDSNGTATV